MIASMTPGELRELRLRCFGAVAEAQGIESQSLIGQLIADAEALFTWVVTGLGDEALDDLVDALEDDLGAPEDEEEDGGGGLRVGVEFEQTH